MQPLAAVRLRNQLRALRPDLEISLRDVRVNRVLFGCSGFVTDPKTGRIVYVNTDHNHGTRFNNAYYRIAESTKDYTGGPNHFSTYADLPEKVIRMLEGKSPV